MEKFRILTAMLPAVFMIHDFEEIVFLRPWLFRNSAWIQKRFPFIPGRLMAHMSGLSVSAFTLAVAEEFVLLSAVTYISLFADRYSWWMAAFMGFSVHLVIHLIQWLMIRRYVPVIVTTLLALPYCIFTFIEIVRRQLFNTSEIVLLCVAGSLFAAINVALVHRLAAAFDRRTRT